METYISDFCTSFYIPEIENPAFRLPCVRIVWTNYCGNTLCEAFKRRKAYQDLLCSRDYDEIVVAIFSHQIQSEYYGRNIYVPI